MSSHGKVSRRSTPSPARVDTQLQLASPAWRNRIRETIQQTRPDRGQPVEVAQLAASAQMEPPQDCLPGMTFFWCLALCKTPCQWQAEKGGGAGGGTRTPTGISPTDFLTIYGFRRRHLCATGALAGLWSGLSLHRIPAWCRDLGAARLVSTPSRPGFSGRAWLGIAILQVSPNLSSFASPVSRQSTQV